MTRELWIERDDFTEAPPKGYFRLSPGAEVRLRYGYIIKCVGAERDAQGNLVAVHCTYDPSTRSGTPGAEARKVKGNIHWLAARYALGGGGAPLRSPVRGAATRTPDAAVRGKPGRGGTGPARPPADAIFDDEAPFDEATERNYLDDLNPAARTTVTAYVEPALVAAPREARYQFERHGYFVADVRDHERAAPGVQSCRDAARFMGQGDARQPSVTAVGGYCLPLRGRR